LHIEPSFWGGLLVVILSVVGSIVWIVMLFDWDSPATKKADRAKDITREFFG